MYENERRKVIETALKMLEYRLIVLSGGNVSARLGDGTFLITPSAMAYETLEPEDIVRIDAEGNVVEGEHRPSSDYEAVLYIYRHRPDVHAVIHTHQPYATAVGLIGDKLPACLTTIIDTNHGDVPVAPFTVSSDVGMGETVIACGRDSNAVILGNHGVIAMGECLEEALETAVYLEEGAKTYLAAEAAGKVRLLTRQQIEEEDRDRGNYGQD